MDDFFTSFLYKPNEALDTPTYYILVGVWTHGVDQYTSTFFVCVINDWAARYNHAVDIFGDATDHR